MLFIILKQICKIILGNKIDYKQYIPNIGTHFYFVQLRTFFLFISIFPYTKMSLNKKNCLGLGFLRQILVNTPSPTNTRPGTANGWN